MRKSVFFTVLLAILLSSFEAFPAQREEAEAPPSQQVRETAVPKAVPAGQEPEGERGRKVTPRFLPMQRRVDRGINDIVFAYRGEMALGLAASYGTLTSEDTNLMLLLDGIELKGSVFTLNPSFGYFIRDNVCVGARFGYTRTQGRLGNISLNLGESNDISMSLSGVDFRNQMTSFGAFVRSYAGVDPKGHFGLFGELELTCKMGTSRFAYASEEDPKGTASNNMQVKVAFNSGVAVYIFPNVCCTLSFGLGGLQFNRVNQMDPDGNTTGVRKASKMLFRLNLADIRIGFNIHL